MSANARGLASGKDDKKDDKDDDKNDDKNSDKKDGKKDDNENKPALVVTTAPGGAVAGLAFTVQPVLALRNHDGELVMANKSVTASLVGSTVALGGTKTVTLSKGVARFTNLSIPTAGTYTLQFSGKSFGSVQVTITVAPRTVPLAIALVGGGTVTWSPSGTSCGAPCSAEFTPGTLVTLTAQASNPSAWSFAGWSGDACAITGPGTCQLTMDAAKSVTATFTPMAAGPPVLSMSITGAGDIAADRDVNPADGLPDVLCTAAQGSCTSTETLNTNVTLIAQPATGSTFVGWGGACASAGNSIYCDVLMNAAQSVTAEFSTPQQVARNSTSNLTSFTVSPRNTRVGGTQ